MTEHVSVNFEQVLRSHRDEIAYEWYQSFQSIGSLIYFREEAIQKFQELTDAVIEYLVEDIKDPEKANTIGLNLAKLHVLSPRVIEVTGDLWSRILNQLDGLEGSKFNYLWQARFYQIFAGYYEKSRQIILTEQEQIRQALMATIEKTSNELRRYQQQLQEILRDRTQELELTARNFQQITETSLEGILQMDLEGNVIFANQAYAEIVGYSTEELKGKPIRELMGEQEFAEIPLLFQRVLSGEHVRTEFVLTHKNGTPKHVIGSAVCTEVPGGVVLTSFVTDITDRIHAEEELRRSENKYRTLAETAQVMIIILNREDRVEYINNYASSFLHLKPEDIVGKVRSNFFDDKSNEKMKKSLERSFRGIPTNFIENHFRFRKSSMWLRSSIVPMKFGEGEIQSVIIISTDITEIKNSQKELMRNKLQLEKRVKERTAKLEASQEQSRMLARQIVKTQEEERRRVSRELHDQSGQALVSLKYELMSSFQELGRNPGITEIQYKSMMEAIDKTMAQIRQLSHSLRPPTLDMAGINLSLEDYCLETAERTGLKIEYTGEQLEDVPEEIAISLFRILQEALTNVWKHAKATRVSVMLGKQNSTIKLIVEDNGIGAIDTGKNDGIGLLGIRERVEILGGSIHIHSQPQKGLHLMISIPWQSGN